MLYIKRRCWFKNNWTVTIKYNGIEACVIRRHIYTDRINWEYFEKSAYFGEYFDLSYLPKRWAIDWCTQRVFPTTPCNSSKIWLGVVEDGVSLITRLAFLWSHFSMWIANICDDAAAMFGIKTTGRLTNIVMRRCRRHVW